MDFHDALADYGMKSEDVLEGRNYSFLLGKITNIDDSRVRVKARIGAQEDSQESDWLLPAAPGGIEGTPNVGDIVLVAGVDGDFSKAFYLCTVGTTSKDRPTEHLVLGDTFIGMFNNLVAQFNQLRTDFINHQHLGPATTCVNGAPWTGSTNSPTAGSSSTAAQKAKGSNGSEVAAISSSEVVLSGKTKTR